MRCIFEEHILTGGGKEGPHLNDFRVRTISFFFSSAIWLHLSCVDVAIAWYRRSVFVAEWGIHIPNNASSSLCFSAKDRRKRFASYPTNILCLGISSSHAVRFRVCFINEEPNGVDSAPYAGHLVLGFEGLPSRPEIAFRTSDYNLRDRQAGGVIAVFTSF